MSFGIQRAFANVSEQTKSQMDFSATNGLPIETKDWQQDIPLCNRCLTLLSLAVKSDNNSNLELIHSAFNDAPTSCPICRRACSAFSKTQLPADQEWTWVWKLNGRIPEWGIFGIGRLNVAPQLSIYFHAESKDASTNLDSTYIQCAFFLTAELMHDALWGLPKLGWNVDDGEVHLKFVQAHLDDCRDNHTRCHDGLTGWCPPNLKHVDGREVEGLQSAKYLALLGIAPEEQVVKLARGLGIDHYSMGGQDRKIYIHAHLTAIASDDTLEHQRDVYAETGFKIDLGFLGDADLLKKELRLVWSDSGHRVGAREKRARMSLQYLAPRSLSVFSDRLMWTCDEYRYMERAGRMPALDSGYIRQYIGERNRPVTLEAEKQAFMRAWYAAVHVISGDGGSIEPVAEEMSSVMGKLIHGHWEKRFSEQLTWECRGSALRPSVPSWSWMSRPDDEVQFHGRWGDTYKELVDVLSIEPLRLCGHLRDFSEDHTWAPDLGSFEETPDVELIHSIVDNEGGLELVFIALKKIGEDVYQRIGLGIEQLYDEDPIILQLLEYDGDLEIAKRRPDAFQDEIEIV